MDIDKDAIVRQAIKLTNAYFALTILKQHNRLKNDRDAYLLEIIDYGLGERKTLPDKKDFALD